MNGGAAFVIGLVVFMAVVYASFIAWLVHMDRKWVGRHGPRPWDNDAD